MLKNRILLTGVGLIILHIQMHNNLKQLFVKPANRRDYFKKLLLSMEMILTKVNFQLKFKYSVKVSLKHPVRSVQSSPVRVQ